MKRERFPEKMEVFYDDECWMCNPLEGKIDAEEYDSDLLVAEYQLVKVHRVIAPKNKLVEAKNPTARLDKE